MTKSMLLFALAFLAACAAPTEVTTDPSPTDPAQLSVSRFMVYPNGAGVLGTVDNAARTLTAVVPHTANLANVLAVVTHNGTAIAPPDNEFSDFSQPVTYSIKAADGQEHQYTATVTKELAPKSITGFRFNGLAGAEGVINEGDGTIAVLVPNGTNRNGLVPVVNFDGVSVVPFSGAAQDFTQPVAYTVTAADGLTRVYTVTVTVDPKSSTKDITAFGFDNTNGNPQLFVVTSVGTDIFVAVTGADVTTLIPIVIHNGVKVTPPSGVQRDFTNPVTFTVEAENGTTKTYTVTLLVHP